MKYVAFTLVVVSFIVGLMSLSYDENIQSFLVVVGCLSAILYFIHEDHEPALLIIWACLAGGGITHLIFDIFSVNVQKFVYFTAAMICGMLFILALLTMFSLDENKTDYEFIITFFVLPGIFVGYNIVSIASLFIYPNQSIQGDVRDILYKMGVGLGIVVFISIPAYMLFDLRDNRNRRR